MATYDAYRTWRLALASAIAVTALAGCNAENAERGAQDESLPPEIRQERAEESALPDTSAQAAVVIAPMPPPPASTENSMIPVDVIVLTPASHMGRAVSGVAKVVDVPTDRGFWLENNGQKIFAVIAQSPGMEQAVNVNTGQTLRLAGVVYDRSLASGIAGQLDPQARQIIEEQPAFLLVDARNIVVLDTAAG